MYDAKLTSNTDQTPIYIKWRRELIIRRRKERDIYIWSLITGETIITRTPRYIQERNRKERVRKRMDKEKLERLSKIVLTDNDLWIDFDEYMYDEHIGIRRSLCVGYRWTVDYQSVRRLNR